MVDDVVVRLTVLFAALEEHDATGIGCHTFQLLVDMLLSL